MMPTHTDLVIGSGLAAHSQLGGRSVCNPVPDRLPLVGLSWAFSLKRRSGDLSPVVELKFELFDHLGQPLVCKGISGFQSELPGLLQLPLQRSTVYPCHLITPANRLALLAAYARMTTQLDCSPMKI
jgi:hypothetical protein